MNLQRIALPCSEAESMQGCVLGEEQSSHLHFELEMKIAGTIIRLLMSMNPSAPASRQTFSIGMADCQLGRADVILLVMTWLG